MYQTIHEVLSLLKCVFKIRIQLCLLVQLNKLIIIVNAPGLKTYTKLLGVAY